MKRRILPTRIVLPELPDEGREFLFDREGEELNKALKDLVGENPYKIEFKIQPLGNIFQLRGRLEAQMDLQCSRCGTDFKFQVDQPVNELLVLQASPLARGDTTSRVNHTSDLAEQEQEATHLESPVFDVGEFFHEIIALAEPIRPLGGSACEAFCEDLLEKYNQSTMPQEKAEEVAAPGKHKPFLGLKDLKIN